MQAFIKQRKTQDKTIKVEEPKEIKTDTKKELKIEPIETAPIQETNKHKEVLRHLMEQGSITTYEAFQLYGATRLSAIIFDLRKRGHNIVTKETVGQDRYGHVSRFATYVLED